MSKITERRDYFRINDVIGLSYSVIKCGEPLIPSPIEDDALRSSRTLAEIDIQFNQAANTVWQESPAVAQALGLLNKKISLLAEYLPNGHGENLDSFEEQTASISGCGMAFHAGESLTEGTRLRVSVALHPSNTIVHFTASVVACEHLSDRKTATYLIRIEIDEDNQVAREQLVQHVVQKQYENLDAHRKFPDSELG